MLGETREVVEQLHQILSELGPAREQSEIGVELGGFGVVVSGADVHIAAQSILLSAHHKNNLGVGFQPKNPVHHMHAGPFQLPCPLNVVVFIKSGFQLHKSHHLLAVF